MTVSSTTAADEPDAGLVATKLAKTGAAKSLIKDRLKTS